MPPGVSDLRKAVEAERQPVALAAGVHMEVEAVGADALRSDLVRMPGCVGY